MVESSGRQHASDPTGEATRNRPVFVPLADIYETKDALHLLVEMPGVDAKDLNITLEQRVLTIIGRARQHAPAGYSPVHSEYRVGDYERTFSVSESIDAERIEAVLTDGLLRMHLPKSQPAPAKTISVKSAE